MKTNFSKLFFISILFISFFILSTIAPKLTYGQANSVWCSSNCDTTINCDSGYRVPNACASAPNNCCRTLANEGIGGSCDASGACNCSEPFHACIPESEPTPSPAAYCRDSEECRTTADSYTCTEIYHGRDMACYLAPGENGDCCAPIDQSPNTCTNNGGSCRRPSEQDVPGECGWNEILQPWECFPEDEFPPGTICCDPATVVSCPGTCRDVCLTNEVSYADINECGEAGQLCCLENFAPPAKHDELCGDGSSINTAIGCIPVESTRGFVDFLLRWGVGIAGGVALILIAAAGIMIITSSGDPKRMQAGKELLTAAVSGLVLLVFGVFVLEFIGVDILNIPGFG